MKVAGEDTESRYHKMFRLTDDLIVCSSESFEKNVGNFLQEIQYADLNCPVLQSSDKEHAENCSSNCSCSLNRYYRETKIDCSNQHLTSFPNLFLLNHESDSIILHLENNSLTDLPQEVLNMNYQNITHLYLGHNMLSEFTKDMIPAKLKHIELDHNRIEAFAEEDMRALENFVLEKDITLKLGNNPYSCSCDNKYFYNFVLATHQQIKGEYRFSSNSFLN